LKPFPQISWRYLNVVIVFVCAVICNLSSLKNKSRNAQRVAHLYHKN